MQMRINFMHFCEEENEIFMLFSLRLIVVVSLTLKKTIRRAWWIEESVVDVNCSRGKSENQIDEASRRLKSDRVIEYLETPHQIDAKRDRIDWVDLAPSETHAMQINCELLFFSHK